jgi:hypothetical protein
MSYHYLISSLPGISLGDKPALSMDEFLMNCRAQLSKQDCAALESLLDIDNPPSNHSFVNSWIARETQLRNATARLRAARRSKDAVDFIRPHSGFDVSIENRVEDAFNQPTPLEREQSLDRIRWRFLDELAGTDPFSTNALLAYALKLKLAERWAAMDKEKGQTKIEKAVEQTKEKETL